MTPSKRAKKSLAQTGTVVPNAASGGGHFMSLWWRRIRVDSAGSAFSNAGAGGATTSDSNESSIQHRGNRLERVSISIGVACYPEHGTTGEALLRSADQALYRAKEEGRDRVMMAKSR